jgi:RNA-directed DNA polymerase
MNEPRQSDGPMVPAKPSNKGQASPRPAERVEGRGPAEGNAGQQNRDRTEGRSNLQSALERIREAASQDRKMRFTALWHHVYDPERLKEAYLGLKRDAAAGVDAVTWQQYGEGLEEKLQDLSERLKRGTYRARPVRRVHIPKPDGKQRPIGVPALEDKLVQRATVEVLEAIYEVDFLGFSYGFRPGRSPHHALDALSVAITHRKVNWLLDADLQAFFDSLSQEWLVRFLEQRIADERVLRHIQKWLGAGELLQDGQVEKSSRGTVQGGSISPLLANVYLHHALDLFVQHWRRTRAEGQVIFVHL